jgi:hypothetical protein
VSQGARTIPVVELSSLHNALSALQYELGLLDVEDLSGPDASRVIDAVSSCKNSLNGKLLSVAGRAISVSQPSLEGARSNASWLASKMGTSERQARFCLAVERQLRKLPEIELALASGNISLEKAALIARAADGDLAMASELLGVALTSTYETLNRKAQELTAKKDNDDPEKRHERQRRSQYVNIGTRHDSMVTGHFRLLPEQATALLEANRKARGANAWERAESFVSLLSESGTKRTEIVFHLDLNGVFGELKDVGPVSIDAVMRGFANASFKLVGNYNNKLQWFSESDRRSSTKDLPEYVKRAIKANAYDRCEEPDCTRTAEEVDHRVARSNGGINELTNLQALCGLDHNAKTKMDAPWTAEVIYGKATGDPSDVCDASAPNGKGDSELKDTG